MKGQVSRSGIIDVKKDSLTYTLVDEQARPAYDLKYFLAQNLIYPNQAYDNNIEGTLIIKFIVEKDGQLSNISVIRGKELAHGLPEECMRVIKAAPKWIPAKVNGETVKSWITIPIKFKMNQKVEDLNFKLGGVQNTNELVNKKDENQSNYENNVEYARPEYDMKDYISRNIIYSKEALTHDINGKVTLKFTVEIDGRLSHVKVVNGLDIGFGIPEECIRLFNNAPNWIPALVNGKIIKSEMIMPIEFNINNAIKKSSTNN